MSSARIRPYEGSSVAAPRRAGRNDGTERRRRAARSVPEASTCSRCGCRRPGGPSRLAASQWRAAAAGRIQRPGCRAPRRCRGRESIPRGRRASRSSAPDPEVERGNKERALLPALASGQADLRSGFYDAAVREFTEALRHDPNYGEALINRGLAHLLKADYDRAVQDFTAAIQLQPSSDLFANRALAHFNKAEYDRAIQDYTEAIRFSSSDPELFNYRGASYASLRDYDRAIQDYDQAIRLKPHYPMALNNRGWAYSQKGDRVRAIADYLSALKLKPEDRLRQHLEAALNSLGFQGTMARGQ